MATDGRLSWVATIDNSQLRKKAQESQQAIGRIGTTAVQAGRQVDNAAQQMGRSIQQGIGGAVGNIKEAVVGLGKQMVGLSAIMAGGAFIKGLQDEINSFNKNMVIVSTISDEVTQDLDGYKQKVMDICKQIAIAPATAADALYQINSAGHLGAAGLDVLEASAKAAVAGVTDTAVAADAITTILNAYGMASSEATSISDKLFTTVRLGKTTMGELGQSIAAVAPTAATFGVSIDEVLAMIAELTKQGTPTASAIRQIQQAILATTQSLGDGAFKTRTLLQAFEEVEKKSDGSENALKKDMGNVNALRAVLSATGSHAEETAQMLKEMQNSAGATESAFGKMNATAGSQMQILRNNFTDAFRSMIGSVTSSMGGIAKTLNEAFNDGTMQKLIDAMGVAIVVIGTYKATVLAASMVQSIYTKATEAKIAAITAELNAVGVQTAEQKIAADADIAAAVAKGQLTQAQALELLTLKQEATARAEALAALATESAQIAANAVAAEAAAQAKLAAAQQDVAAMTKSANTAIAKGDAFAIAYYQEQLETAQSALSVATNEAQAASAAKVATAKTAQTASTNAQTAAQQLNNISITAGTASTNLFTIATNAANKAVKALWASMMKHPIAWVAAAVAGLVTWLYKLSTQTDAADESQRRLNESISASQNEANKEIVAARNLFNALQNAKEGTEQYRTIKDKIIEQYGSYLKGLIDEKGALNDIAAAYNRVEIAARDAAAAKGLEKSMGDIAETYDGENGERTNIKKKMRANLTSLKGVGEDLADTYMALILNDIDRLGDVSIETMKMIEGSTPGEGAKSVVKNLKSNIASYRKSTENMQSAQANAQEGFSPYMNEYKNYDPHVLDARIADLKEQLTTESEQFTEIVDGVEKVVFKSRAEASLALQKMETARSAMGDGETKKSTATPTKTLTDKEKREAQKRADEAAERKLAQIKLTEETAKAIRDAELQAEEDLLATREDSLDKELKQNEIDYQKRINQAIDQAEAYRQAVIEAKMLEWKDANPKATKAEETNQRISLMDSVGMNDVPQEQRDVLRKQNEASALAFEKANRDALMNALGDLQSYVAQRQRILDQEEKDIEKLYQRDDNGNIQTGVFIQGASQADEDEIRYQANEAVKNLDNEIASRSELYQAWCNQIAQISLDRLLKMLDEAKKQLDSINGTEGVDESTVASARAKVNALEKQIRQRQAEKDALNSIDPNTETITKWNETANAIGDCSTQIKSIGEAVGGTAGEILGVASTVMDSTVSIIQGITSLVSGAATAMVTTSGAAASAIKMMERASVILAVISAALAAATLIASLFNNDEAKQKKIEKLQTQVDSLRWVLDNKEANRLKVQWGSAFDYIAERVGKVTTTVEKSFRTIRGETQTYLKTVTDWDALLDDIVKQHVKMGYSAGLGLGMQKYKEASSEMRNLAEQQKLYYQMIEQESSKKDSDSSKIQEYKEKIEELSWEIQEIIQDMMESLIGDSAENIANTLGDAFIEAAANGEDALDALNKSVDEIIANMVKKLLIQQYLQPQIAKIFDKYYSTWFDENGNFNGTDILNNSIDQFRSDLQATGTEFAQSYEIFDSALKDLLETTERTAESRGIATASQDSVDENNARLTVIQSHTYALNEGMKVLQSNSSQILKSVMGIETNTTNIHSRLGDLEDVTRSIRSTVEDISIRGIKLK